MGGPAYVDGDIIEEFDNFEYTPFRMDGKMWISAEQAYQASKFEDESYREKIRNTTQSTLIYEMGQSREHAMKPDFSRKKSMNRIIAYKLYRNRHILEKLMKTTGTITFPESDKYWGTNDGQGGKNVLGQIYMELRDKELWKNFINI